MQRVSLNNPIVPLIELILNCNVIVLQRQLIMYSLIYGFLVFRVVFLRSEKHIILHIICKYVLLLYCL